MNDIFVALVDGNNFFASCEVLKNPALKGKAVCVLSNNDGCVIARSNEAKKLGIKMGIPYFIAKKQFPQAVYLSADFSFYQNLSARMMKYLENYSDKIDVYSIDEAFIDVTGINKVLKTDFRTLALKIKNDIESNIGASVSIGIANSKILAKIATHKAKLSDGAYYIEKEFIKEELKGIPVEEIWGVGRNISRSLRAYGIFYANEILEKEDKFFKTKYGKKGLELKYELMGISVIPLTGVSEKPKSIQRTRAFPKFSSDKNYIKEELDLHLHNVCKKLRENNLETLLIGVMLRTKDFHTFYKCIKLEYPANSEFILKPVIIKLFNEIFKENTIYRSSGIYAGILEDTCKFQMNLFSLFSYSKEKTLSNMIDKVEFKHGKGALAIGSTGIKTIRNSHKRVIHENLQ